MNDPTTLPSPDPDRQIGHETSDASAYHVSLFALGLILMIALVLPVLSWMFWRFEAAARQGEMPRSVLTVKRTVHAPILQDNPLADLTQLRMNEDQRLSSYEWLDQGRGSVRIPIDRAIEILSERGLPEPKESEAPPTKKGQAP